MVAGASISFFMTGSTAYGPVRASRGKNPGRRAAPHMSTAEAYMRRLSPVRLSGENRARGGERIDHGKHEI